MADTTPLIKANPLLPAEDYEGLRKTGINDIAATASTVWTDYNFSDPGITILEAVTYAITDLAYRTGFDVKDLLAPQNLTEDTWKQIFYTARQILQNAALTIDDYRKLIIDVAGIRNAWVTPSKDYEVPLWIDYNAWDYRKDMDCACNPPKYELCLGRLGLNPIDISVYTKEWADKKKALIEKTPVPGALAALNAALKKIDNDLRIAEKGYDPDKPDDTAKKALDAAKKAKSDWEKQNHLLQEQMIEELKLVSRIPLNSKIVELEGLYTILIEYEDDITDNGEQEAIRQKVIERLAANRNLCEDVLSVDPVEYEDFGMGASFVVEENADTDAILAQVFFRIFKYFTPSVPFHTIQQMQDLGLQIDEIFEGPALDHGFVANSELELTDFFRDLHLSDLINSISDIPGIIAITYLHLPFHGFQADTDRLYFNRWIDYLREQRKVARIQPTLSQAIFCKERDIVTYYTGGPRDRRPERMLKLFKDLKTLERKYKLEGVLTDLPVPAGEYMALEDYYPVTYSLPACYGVSDREGLGSNADPKRKVQALQLRGYMLFFEQVLADYLVQLDHLKDLFSFDDTIDHTYFSRALTELTGLQDLLIDKNNRGADHFDQILQDFTQVLQQLAEPVNLFYSRRNQFLNHLLARFSEDLSDYESICRWLVPDNIDQRLIGDKTRLLKDGEYIHISSERGLGYNYALTNTWESSNISGTERRIGRLLGFGQTECRSLAPDFIGAGPSMDSSDKTKPPQQKKDPNGKLLNVITLTDPDDPQTILLTSVDVKDGCCTDILMDQLLAHADDRIYYQAKQDMKRKTRRTSGLLGSFWYELYDDTDPATAALVAWTDQFDTQDKADQALQRVFAVMALINSNEGLHLLEHILLRPKLDIEQDETMKNIEVKFLEICLDNCDLGLGLGEGVEYPLYRIKISRIPADKCYDKMPWILDYLRPRTKTALAIDYPFLFQQVAQDNTVTEMKFRQYTTLAQRIKDLREYGSERINYEIVNNGDAANLKYGFIIHQGGVKGPTLAQSKFEYNLRPPHVHAPVTDDIEEAIRSLMLYFEFELDLYCEADPCDNNEDPYSFRATAVLPCWPARLRDKTFRNLVEKTILTESPAHVQVRIVWLGITEMRRFETAYRNWLVEMAQTEIPGYEKVNPLVDVLNTLKPCGYCEEECS